MGQDIHEPAPKLTPETATTIPENLPERVRLTRTFDSQFMDWSDEALSQHPAYMQIPMAERIVNDCQIIDDIPSEVAKRSRFGQPSADKLSLEIRLQRLAILMPYAHDPTYDVDPEYPPSASYFKKAQEWLESRESSEAVLEAFRYLKRLYVVRESLARHNGVETFPGNPFGNVLTRVLADEHRLNSGDVSSEV